MGQLASPLEFQPHSGRHWLKSGRLAGSGILLGTLVAVLSVGCGSRTILRPGPEFAYCERSEDCNRDNLCELETCIDNACIPDEPVLCEASDVCLEAACNPETGLCEERPLTSDLDGDGFLAPLSGFAPGEAGACGDDCDDTSSAAYPGGDEVCDGVDNDCDGVVDNQIDYLAQAQDAIPQPLSLAPSFDGSGGHGIAYGDGVFATSYAGNDGTTLGYLHGFDDAGQEWFPRTSLSNVNAPSFGASLAWSGQVFGAAWEDTRLDSNYEVYFARFDSLGQKLGPDVRVTNAPDFSVHTRAFFDGGRFVLVWDDHRDVESTGMTRVFAQFLDSEGVLIGSNMQLSDDREYAEYPILASTVRRFGMVYTVLDAAQVSLRFRSFDKELGQSSPPIVLQNNEVRSPRIAALGDRFVVTWEVYGDGPGASIMGVVVSEDGEILVPPTALTFEGSFSRDHDTLSLGDRFLLFWANDRDANFELYGTTLSPSFEEIEAPTRLTNSIGDSLLPKAALGGAGTLGLLFDDNRDGRKGAYFMTLGCAEQSQSEF